MEQVNQKLSEIEKALDGIPAVQKITEKAGVPTRYLILGVVGFLLFLMVFGFGADVICNFIGTAYPAYMSIKAIESPGEQDDKLWLTYWVIFSIFRVVDDWVEVLFSWIPFFFVFKLVFLVYLFAPQTKGAVTIYDSFVGPFLVKHQKVIDEGIDKVVSATSEAATKAKEEVVKQGASYLANNQ